MRHPAKSKPKPNVLGGPLDGDYQSPPWLLCEFTYCVPLGGSHLYRWDGHHWRHTPPKPLVSPGVLDRLYRKERHDG